MVALNKCREGRDDSSHFLRRGLGMEDFAEIVLENLLGVDEVNCVVKRVVLFMISKRKRRNEIQHENQDIHQFVGVEIKRTRRRK